MTVEVYGDPGEEYQIEGSSEIRRKVDASTYVVLGKDVFSLCIKPGFDGPIWTGFTAAKLLNHPWFTAAKLKHHLRTGLQDLDLVLGGQSGLGFELGVLINFWDQEIRDFSRLKTRADNVL